MNRLTLLLIMFIPITSSAQKTTEYKASNGITYHVGDTVNIGRGSSVDGWFKYILASSLNTSDSQRDWFKRKFTNTGLIIKSIDYKEVNGIKKYSFKMGSKALYNVFISIDEAIADCEVIPCAKTPVAGIDKFDQLKKLKGLLDDKILTQSEYDKQKEKLLNQ